MEAAFVCEGNLASDVETKARARYEAVGCRSPIKALEDAFALPTRYRGALVRHANERPALLRFHDDLYRGVRPGIPERVIDQLSQHQREQFLIGRDFNWCRR